MEIKTKFNIGQMVWILDPITLCIYHKKIDYVRVCAGEGYFSVKYEVANEEFDEDNVFENIEKAGQQLKWSEEQDANDN